jgi:hypothetical protein
MPIQVNKLNTITGHNDCIYTLQGSPTPNRFFSASGDGMIVSWDLASPENGELIARLPNSVYALHHHPSSGLLVAGHNYEGIHFLDWQNKIETGSLQLTKAAVFDIKSFGNRLVVATGDGTVSLVDADSLTIRSKVQQSGKSARTIDIHEERGEIAVGYSDNFIRIFDLDLNLKHEWQAHDNSVFTVRYAPDGAGLFSGSRDARLKLWNLDSYTKAAEIVAHMYAINHLDFSPDKKHFVTCSLDKSIKVWDTKELKLLKVIDRARHGGHRTSVNKLLWTSYNDQLLSASDDRTISVWHLIF